MHPGRVPERIISSHGVAFLSHPFRVPDHFSIASGGLRCASTTGYFLRALQAAHPSITLLHPPLCNLLSLVVARHKSALYSHTSVE